MLEMIVSFFAVIVAFSALWFAGEANKRAEFQQQQFYDAYVKPLKTTMANFARASYELAKRVNDVEKMVDGLIETNEDLELGTTLAVLRGEVSSLRSDVDGIGIGSGEPRPQRRRMV